MAKKEITVCDGCGLDESEITDSSKWHTIEWVNGSAHYSFPKFKKFHNLDLCPTCLVLAQKVEAMLLDKMVNSQA